MHLNDNTQQPQPGHPDLDKLYKLLPLLNLLGNKCQKLVIAKCWRKYKLVQGKINPKAIHAFEAYQKGL